MTRKTIVVIELGWLGDSVVSLPAVRALRASHPEAWITRVANSRVTELLDGCPYVDELLPYRREGGKAVAALRLLRAIRARRAAMVINLHTPDFDRSARLYLRDNLFARLTGAGVRVAYHRSHDRALLTHGLDYREFGGRPMHEEMLRLVAPVAPVTPEGPVPFWLTEANRAQARALLAGPPLRPRGSTACRGPAPAVPVGSGFFCVSAFGKRRTREWSFARFSEVASRLAEATGLTPVLLGSPADRGKVPAIARHLRVPHVDLVGRTSVMTAAAVLELARLAIAVDSGLMHLAALTGTPTVALFGPGDPVRWRPLPQARLELVHSTASCAPCFLDACPDLRCQDAITVEEVLAAARRALDKG